MIRICGYCGLVYDKEEQGYNKYCSDKCTTGIRRDRNRDRWRAANPGWDEGTNKVCEWCGQAFTVSARNAHIARYCSGECQKAWYGREILGTKSREEYREEMDKQAEETRREKMIAQAERRFKNYRISSCEVCGKAFSTFNKAQKTCSKTCSRKRKNRLARRDDRINENNNIDRDISLETLYKRDEGICYICGGSCDFDDHQRTDGHFICGPNYPSIDHIVPLARGGMHAWDNVKLAHHLCNARKSDILPSELELDTEIEEAYAMARKVSPRKKQVKQFTRDGLLIATYESTAEAERITGFKQRQIQSCARGEDKSYRGYLWVY